MDNSTIIYLVMLALGYLVRHLDLFKQNKPAAPAPEPAPLPAPLPAPNGLVAATAAGQVCHCDRCMALAMAHQAQPAPARETTLSVPVKVALGQ